MSLPQISAFGNTSEVIGLHIPFEKLVDIPDIPVAQLYKHMINQDGPTLPFNINMDMREESFFLHGSSWPIQGPM